MRKNILRQEKGISMISLIIAIIIIFVVTGMLVYNSYDSIYIKNLTGLYNDIDMLREKVSDYYNKYGQIPAEIRYTNIAALSDVLSQNNDTGDFFVIDLEAMEGITLNYGKDYEKVKNDSNNANNYNDLYIINENSHNIFYVKGIQIKQNNEVRVYYTNYIEPDNIKPDIRYINNILIPEGYYYIGTINDNSGNESIVISNIKEENVDITQKNQYVWIKQISKIDSLPSSVVLNENQVLEEFITSTNIYQGYFKNSQGNVEFVKSNETKWSDNYSKELEYIDRNNDKVNIPKGFKVSLEREMDTIKNGLVVKDENDNEWVWINVPKNIFTKAKSDLDYDNIKLDISTYISNYSNENYVDEWFSGCGISTETEYNRVYNGVLSSIYKNEGFWISRYEAGISSPRTTSSEATELPKFQKNLYPYNWITQNQSQSLSNNLVSGKQSGLMFGFQWDLVCIFIEKNALNIGMNISTIEEAINVNSIDLGNYKNSEFILNNQTSKYCLDGINWTSTPQKYNKNTSNTVLLSTGATVRNSVLNIFDIAGNEAEWTMEKSINLNSPYTIRGGSYIDNSYEFMLKIRDSKNSYSGSNISFRCMLY